MSKAYKQQSEPSNLNRIKKVNGQQREVAGALDHVSDAGSARVLWNNELAATFPSKRRLIEDEFRKNQVLHILNGEVSEDYSVDHPEPLFRFALEKVKSVPKKSSRGKHVADPVEYEWEQPDCDTSKSVDADEIIVLKDIDSYYSRLGFYNNLRSTWAKERKEHDKLVLRANNLFDRVFGQRTLDLALDVRRESGMAAAWNLIKTRYTPKSTNLALEIVKRDWTQMKKVPDQSMIEFFVAFKRVRTQLRDLGRMPDNVDQFGQLKLALMYDDVKYGAYWSPTIRDVLKEHDIEEADFMDVIENELIVRDTEVGLEKQAQISSGTYSSDRRAARDQAKQLSKVNSQLEVAMQTEAAAKTQGKGRPKADVKADTKADAKADVKAGSKPAPAPTAKSPTTPSGKASSQADASASTAPAKENRKCFRCGLWGHIAANCKGDNADTALACDEEGYDSDGVVVEHARLAMEVSNVATAESVPKYFDSACSSMMSPPTAELTDFIPGAEKINLAGKGHSIVSEGRGKIGKLQDVMISSDLRQTLVSIPKFDRDHKYTVFGNGKAYVMDEPPILRGQVFMSATLGSNNMYKVDDETTEMIAAADEAPPANNKPFRTDQHREVHGSFGLLRAGSTATLNMKQVLHRRLGHINERAIENLLKHNAVLGAGTTYEAIKAMPLGLCDACLRGKMHARHVPTSLSRDRAAMKPMEQIAMDPVPMIKQSLQGNTYATIGVDLATSYAFAVPARTKGNQIAVLEKVMALAERYGHVVKELHTDSDSVYLEQDFDKFCKKNKIRQKQSTPYIHQENGSAERMVETTCDGTRVAMIDAQASSGYWEYAMQMQVYNHNRTLHGQGETKTPFEKMTGRKPDISLLRPFGAHCWAHITAEERAGEGARWCERSMPGIIAMMGYSETVPGAYLVQLSANPPVVKVRRNVVVAECPTTEVLWSMGKPLGDNEQIVGDEQGDDEDGVDDDEEEVTTQEDQPQPRRTTRVHVPNKHYAGSAVELDEVPKDLTAAMTGAESDCWRTAVHQELHNYKSRGGLTSIARQDIPKGSTILGMKKVFKRSKLSDTAYKYKFRLAVQGFRQREGVDYTDTYSPTVMVKTVMTVLHLAAHYGWDSYHVDVACAYMEAPPDRVMYIRLGKDLQEHGFSDGEYAVLGTNAYGTKQAGRVWYIFMAGVLIKFVMERSASDVCMFFKWNHDHTKVMIVLVYVDDFGVTGSWTEEIKRFLEHMRKEYTEIKSTSPMQKYVGLELQWNKTDCTVTVGQEQYAAETVQALLSADAKVTNSPLAHTVDYREPVEYDQDPTWETVGKVRYLADRTRPDLSVATGLLGSFQVNPGRKHVRGAEHVLRYVKGTTKAKLLLGGKEPIVLQGAADASYDTKYQCKPTLGFVLYLGAKSGSVLYKSKRATTMANSVGEAETRAASEATREIVWMRGLLKELGEEQKAPTVLRTDSQALIDITKDYSNNPRTGCFNRDIQWLRQCLEDGTIAMQKVAGADNESDVLTKLLPADTTHLHSAKIRGMK